MNENLDLTKILKGCEGIELYSPIFGECTLTQINCQCKSYPINVKLKESNGSKKEAFTKEGLMFESYPNGECLLFPSKEQRDWSKFVRPIKKGTPMMCQKNNGSWVLRYYAYKINNKHSVFVKNSEIFSYPWKGAIIQYKDFDPNDIEGSLKYNIQK